MLISPYCASPRTCCLLMYGRERHVFNEAISFVRMPRSPAARNFSPLLDQSETGPHTGKDDNPFYVTVYLPIGCASSRRKLLSTSTMSSAQITLPSESGREDPIYKPAVQATNDASKSAVFIFLHGLADSAEAIQSRYDETLMLMSFKALTNTQMSPINSNKVENCLG